MQRWEYEVKALAAKDGLQEMADGLALYGNDGWELVAVIRSEKELTEPSILAFLKRPHPLAAVME